ncbi:MAG: cell division protein SepF [Ruminococcaceae bacterium]|nr:cell division protein SepF [Oscillospiraceae bacterium]
MEKKWWFTKKNEPAQDYEDWNNDYYRDAASAPTTPENDDAYATSDTSDVSVVLSAPAKDEPLMKRTFTPATCQDSQTIVDAYKQGRVVVICIEELDKSNFLRLFDYLMGAVQALDGEFNRIDRDTVVLYPYGVDTETDIDELEEEIVEETEEDDEQFDQEDETDSEDLD